MGTVFTGMGSELMYRRYQLPCAELQDFEDNWLRICQQSHDLFCKCGDWAVHFQKSLCRKYNQEWAITHDTGSEGTVPDSGEGTSGDQGGTGEVDSDLECLAAMAAVEADTNGLDEGVSQ